METRIITIILLNLLMISSIQSRPTINDTALFNNNIDDNGENDIEQCKQVELPFGQNLLICNNVINNERFPYGCFMLKFSTFNFKSLLCFIEKNEFKNDDSLLIKQLRKNNQNNNCVRIDYSSYKIDGYFCMTYSWNLF